MIKVNELITNENSFFGTFEQLYSDLYYKLFGDIPTQTLDTQLLVSFGERYSSPLLSHYNMEKVVEYIVTKYGESWKKVNDVLTAEYDVTNPYNMTYTTTAEKTAEKNNTGESTNKTAIVGFDNTEPVDNDIDKNTSTETNTESETITTTNTRKGNNGDTNYTKLITSEIELRKNSFITIVVNDIKTQLTLDIY